MAEGGTESLRNNLCGNQGEKVVEKKRISDPGHNMAFSDLPVTVQSLLRVHDTPDLGPPRAVAQNPVVEPLVPRHNHSAHSDTGLKAILDEAPALLASGAESDGTSDGSSARNVATPEPSAKISNIPTASPPSNHSSSSPAPPQPRSLEEVSMTENTDQNDPASSESGEGSIGSSYLLACCAETSSCAATHHCSTMDALSQPSSSLPSLPQDTTNDLSSPKHAPNAAQAPHILQGSNAPQGPHAGQGPHTPHTPQGPHAPYQPGYMPVMSHGFPMPGMIPPIMCYSVPMGYSAPFNPSLMPHMYANYGGHGYPAMGYNTGQAPPSSQQVSSGQVPPQHLMNNIAWNVQGGGEGGGGGAGGGSSGTDASGIFGSRLDSRNIPVNVNETSSAPSSEDNNSAGTRSYSINPDTDTRLTRLRKPVLEWARMKLERSCRANWEALADARGWNYEEIRAHLTDCRHTGQSPFLTLLETEKFHAYTVQDFLDDMTVIGRKDILIDFKDVMCNNNCRI